MERIRLRNGLNLIVYPMLNTHAVTVGLYIRAGTRYESAENNGITHLLEHIHFRELNTMTQGRLYYNMESMGSTLNAATYYDFMKFTMKIRPKCLRGCIDIFKEILSTYSWNEISLEQEKEVVKNQIREDDFNFSAKSVIRENLFGNSSMAYNIMGSLESADAIDLPHLISYKKEVFNKNNMIACVTGHVSERDIALIKSELGAPELFDGRKNAPSGVSPLLYHRKPNIVLKTDSWDYLDGTWPREILCLLPPACPDTCPRRRV